MQALTDNLISRLEGHALSTPGKTAYLVRDDKSGEKKISYQELASEVKKLNCRLRREQLKGKSVLLVYEDVLQFTFSFLSCICLGIIPVPVPHVRGSKQLSRLTGIIEDAQAVAVLCSGDLTAQLLQSLSGLLEAKAVKVIHTDPVCKADACPMMQALVPDLNDIAFIQYTSGSTGEPKGVVVTHANVMHNQALIQAVFGCDENAVIFSWLPFHHDMGLIGNVLHTLYVGCTCVLVSPIQFIQKPQLWLECIAEYRVTHSGGPNFAYDLCVERIPPDEVSKLDLSSWKIAYNGSEPVRAETMQRFADHFKGAGFVQSAFCPCYGLAEATLLVAGHRRDQAPAIIAVDRHLGSRNKIVLAGQPHPQALSIVSAGYVPEGMEVKIIDPDHQRECDELEEGEICIAGDSVTTGYWNKDNGAFFCQVGSQSFLRTGDLGFFYRGALFAHGRRKEVLIVRGRNYYPQDVENRIAESHGAIEPYGVAIFSTSTGDESFAVVAEIKRNALKDLDARTVIRAIDKAANGFFGVDPHDIILTTPLKIPRTTSGKLQRTRCGSLYRQGQLTGIESKLHVRQGEVRNEKDDRLRVEVVQSADPFAIRKYLVNLIESKAGALPPALLGDQVELTQMGIDSLRAMELINTVNTDLNISLNAAKVLQDNTLAGFIGVIENILWLKGKQYSGKEVIL